MAAEGIRFTQAYAGATVCAPSRCVLMTGKHIGHARVRGNAGKNNPQAQSLRSTDVTVARLLKEAGYSTGLIGKWGLGDVGSAPEGLPRRHGFDYFFGYLNQQHAHNYFPTFLWRNETKVELNNVVPAEEPSGAGVATERREYAHDLLAAETLKFIRQCKDQPFFLYFAPTIPHANNEAKNKGMEVPDLGQYADLTWPEPQKAHAAMVSRLDRDAGRILDLLEELKIEDQTLVLFSSDNGPHREGGYDPGFNRSSGPLRGIKRDHYEGGIRVPMIARWPGKIPQGVVSDATWAFVDMLPTFAELGHATVPSGVDGTSVVPALLGKKQRHLNERFLYWEFHEGGFKQAARWKDWKAVRNGARQPLELYHLSTDLREQQNVAGRHPSIVRRFETFFKTARTDSPDWPVKPAPAGESKS
jgi:arylsulfatase A-like enzyme